MPESATYVEQVAAGSPMVAAIQPSAPFADRGSTRQQWLDVAAGIVLAGALYPVVLAGLIVLVSVASTTWGWMTGRPFFTAWSDTVEVIGGAAMLAHIGGVAGMIWTMLVAAITAPLVYLFVRSLQIHRRIVLVGAVWGGFVGFVAVLPFSLPFVEDLNAPGSMLGVLLVLGLGPGLATIIFQLGGVWGARWALQNGRRASPNEPVAEPSHLRFGLRQLMWITLWLSLLLAAIRISGIPFEFVLVPLCGWLAYQTATLFLGRWLARRIGPWWERRRNRGWWPVLWPR